MVDVGLKSCGSRGALNHQHKGVDLVGAATINPNHFRSELGHNRVNVALLKAKVSKASRINNIDSVSGALFLEDGSSATLKAIANRKILSLS